MSKYLCTVTGKYGDALWQLATAKLIAETVVGGKIDVITMPAYAGLQPLLQEQSWIENAGWAPQWICTGSPHGDQPWLPPTLVWEKYERVWHLGYRGHPGITDIRMPLIDYVAYHQGFKFTKDPAPWIETQDVKVDTDGMPWLAVAFNNDYAEQKQLFMQELQRLVQGEILVTWVSANTWSVAASMIKRAIGFVGDRSALKVLAHAVGQKNVICYEPNPSRNAFGPYGDVFGYPYEKEQTFGTNFPTVDAAETVALQIRTWLKEKSNGITETESGSMR